jgi:hypothetical protein
MNWIQNMNRCVGPASWDASKPKETTMSSNNDDGRMQQRGPEGNLEEYAPRVAIGHEQRANEDPAHMALCLRLIHAAYDANGADLSAWPGRAAAYIEGTLHALADEVETSNNLRLIVEALGASAAEALALLADIKAWDCEIEQMLTLPIALRQRMQATLAAKNAATTHELHAAQEADELRARIEAALLSDEEVNKPESEMQTIAGAGR